MLADKSNTKRLSSCKKTWQTKFGLTMAAISCVSLLLVGCSGGSGSGDDGGGSVSPTINSSPVEGYAVKGPLKNAVVSLYALNLSAADLKGKLLDTGVTNDVGSITDLAVPASSQGPFLLEVSGGKELDGSDPVIPTLRTVIRADQVADKSATSHTKTPIVVTPLTTLITEMARASAVRKNNAVSGSVTPDSFFTTSNGGEMGVQAAVVKTALGLDLLSGINLFTDAPLITGSNDTAAALKHRTVIEVNAALFKQILTEVGTGDANAVFAALAQDLSDGALDGSNAGQSLSALSGHVAEITDILSQSPTALMALPVPGVTGQTIAQLNAVMAQQAGSAQAPIALTITTSTVVASDSDGDGRIDTRDRFPKNPDEWADTDNDCATARAYSTDDYGKVTSGNDACGDNHDIRPNDPSIQTACQLAGADPSKPIAGAGFTKTRKFTKADYDEPTRRRTYLAGLNSCDPNGDALTYEWTVVSVPTSGSVELLGKDSQGNTITKQNMLSSYSAAEPYFTANFAGDYVFSLRVSDDGGTTWSTPSTVTAKIGKGYYLDIDGGILFLSSFAALLLLAVPAKLRKKNIKN